METYAKRVSLVVDGQTTSDNPILEPHVIYAKVYDLDDHDYLLISATLAFCVQAVEERRYLVETVNGEPVKRKRL